MSTPVCNPFHLLCQLCRKQHLFSPIYISCQRFNKVHFVPSLVACVPEAHNNTANYMPNATVADRTVPLTCSECLKYKGSHLLVRRPWQTASTERKECYHSHLKSYLPITWKNHIFCSSGLPLRICQRGVMNTIDNSTRFNTAYERICHRHPDPCVQVVE